MAVPAPRYYEARRQEMLKFNVKILIVLLLVCSIGMLFAQSQKTAVMVATKAGVGSYLTDAKGMTLYYFTRDSKGKSVCTNGCTDIWPVFNTDTLTLPSSLKKADFGQITRPDGKKQITFRGYPLYYYSIDKKAGDTNGQGIGNVWFVINPSNFPAGK